MPETENKPLDTSNPVLVLNDGETFTDLPGCMIAFAPESMETDDIEEALGDDALDTFTFGNDQSHMEISEIAQILKLLMPTQNIQYNESSNKITIER